MPLYSEDYDILFGQSEGEYIITQTVTAPLETMLGAEGRICYRNTLPEWDREKPVCIRLETRDINDANAMRDYFNEQTKKPGGFYFLDDSVLRVIPGSIKITVGGFWQDEVTPKYIVEFMCASDIFEKFFVTGNHSNGWFTSGKEG